MAHGMTRREFAMAASAASLAVAGFGSRRGRRRRQFLRSGSGPTPVRRPGYLAIEVERQYEEAFCANEIDMRGVHVKPRRRLPGRRLRRHFPAPEHLATVASLGGADSHGLHRAATARMMAREVRFVTDSPLEQRGFELVVPPRPARVPRPQNAPMRSARPPCRPVDDPSALQSVSAPSA